MLRLKRLPPPPSLRRRPQRPPLKTLPLRRLLPRKAPRHRRHRPAPPRLLRRLPPRLALPRTHRLRGKLPHHRRPMHSRLQPPPRHRARRLRRRLRKEWTAKKERPRRSPPLLRLCNSRCGWRAHWMPWTPRSTRTAGILPTCREGRNRRPGNPRTARDSSKESQANRRREIRHRAKRNPR